MTPADALETLLAELGELRLRAGNPSCRDISVQTGPGNISHNTVNKVFKELTKRRYMELVVKALEGDVDHFIDLWTAAARLTAPHDPRGPRRLTAAQTRKEAEALLAQAGVEADELVRRAAREAADLVREATAEAAALVRQAEAQSAEIIRSARAEAERQLQEVVAPAAQPVIPPQRDPTAPRQVSVVAPRFHETAADVTVTRWLKRIGEWVDADEPLVEISTDKVDTEIPAPVTGILFVVYVQEDETVPYGAELARLVESPSVRGGTVSTVADGAPKVQPAEPLKVDIVHNSEELYRSPEPWYEAG